MAVQWYYKMAGKEIGPFTSGELKQLADEKRITPNDPVRRETDTEWTLAKNVKGLFPAAGAIPMGVAVPVPPKDPPVVVSAVKDPPVVVPTAKKIPTPPLPKTVQEKKEEPETEAFDFGFDSSVSHGTKTGKAATVKRPASKGGAKAAHKKGAADEGEETEKKPLSKKEIQKRNFMIIAGATGAVIVLAVLILIIVSFKSSSKPEVAKDDSSVEQESKDVNEVSDDGENSDDEAIADDQETEDLSDKEKEQVDAGVPVEWAKEGYKTSYPNGTKMSCTFGSMKVSIKSIKNAKLGDINPNANKNQDRKYCFITIEVKNENKERNMDVPGWGAKGDPHVKLFSGKENQHKTQRISVPDQADSTEQINPGESFTDILVFNTPNLDSIDALRLELPAILSGEKMCKIYLPKEMFQEKKAQAKGENAEGDSSEDGEEKAEADGEGANDAEKAEKSEADPNAEDKKTNESKEPNALEDDALEDKPAAQKPEASSKEGKELDGASEENIDILNDPNLDF